MPCPSGHWTLARGASTPGDCAAHCPPGRTSDTVRIANIAHTTTYPTCAILQGLEPCYPCPRGYFQDQSGMNHCYKCPNKTTTAFHSSSSIEDCLGLDPAAAIAATELEILSVNDCFSLPCHGDAVCQPLDSGFQCQCPPGYQVILTSDWSLPTILTSDWSLPATLTSDWWQGSLCDVEVEPCLSSPCLNQGTCTSHQDHYRCVCQPGFTGQDCEVGTN